jgi:hypothetical protein
MKEQELQKLWDEARHNGLPAFRMVGKDNHWDFDTLIRPLPDGLVITSNDLEGFKVFADKKDGCWVLKLWNTGFYPKLEPDA